MNRTLRKISPFLLWAGVIAACFLFGTQFCMKSDWAWTIQQPIFWKTVGEAAVFFLVYLLLLWLPLPRNWMRFTAIAVAMLGIAFLHAFFWAILVELLYGVMMYLTGYFLLCLYRKNEEIQNLDFHLCIVFGICGLICLVAVASLLKIGTPEKLRPLFILVFAVELFLARKMLVKRVQTLVTDRAFCKPERLSGQDLIVCSLILSAVTIFICRANMCFDFDSLWYGLRSEYVLAPKTGIYDKVTMMSIVFTYSKGIEILALPFSGLDTYSFIIGLNLLFAVFMLHGMYCIGRRTLSESKSRILVMFVALTPAIMLQANTAKADMSMLYLSVAAIYFGVLALQKHSSVYATASLAMLLLTYAFKGTALVFSTLFLVIFLIVFWKYHVLPRKKNIPFLVVPVLSLAAVLARTILLTGYPFNALIVSFLEGLGYYPQYPYTFPSPRSTSLAELFTTDLFGERLLRLFRIFFFPTPDMSTLETTWWGPLASVLWFCAVLYLLFHLKKSIKQCAEDPVYLLSTVLFILISLASGGCMMLLQTPDGNYFMLFLVLIYWFLLASWDESGQKQSLSVRLAIAPLLVCNFVLSILISPAWSLGFTPISLESMGYYNHKQLNVLPRIEYTGLQEVYDYFDNTPEPQRVISIVAGVESGQEQTVLFLPASIEPYSYQQVWGANTYDTYEHFKYYIEYANVDALLVDKEGLRTDEQVYSYLVQMADDGMLKLEKQAGEYAILLVGDLPDADTGAVEYLESVSNMAE